MTEAELRERAKQSFMVVASHAVKILDAKNAEIAELHRIIAEALEEMVRGSDVEAYDLLAKAIAK